jgi:hypothetical protein
VVVLEMVWKMKKEMNIIVSDCNDKATWQFISHEIRDMTWFVLMGKWRYLSSTRIIIHQST